MLTMCWNKETTMGSIQFARSLILLVYTSRLGTWTFQFYFYLSITHIWHTRFMHAIIFWVILPSGPLYSVSLVSVSRIERTGNVGHSNSLFVININHFCWRLSARNHFFLDPSLPVLSSADGPVGFCIHYII